jgi:hypothetical protein
VIPRLSDPYLSKSSLRFGGHPGLTDRELLAGAYQEEAERLQLVAQHLVDKQGKLVGLPALKHQHEAMAKKLALASKVVGDLGLKEEALRHEDRLTELKRIQAVYAHPKNGNLSFVVESIDRLQLIAGLLNHPELEQKIKNKVAVHDPALQPFLKQPSKPIRVKGNIPPLFAAKVSASFQYVYRLIQSVS